MKCLKNKLQWLNFTNRWKLKLYSLDRLCPRAKHFKKFYDNDSKKNLSAEKINLLIMLGT